MALGLSAAAANAILAALVQGTSFVESAIWVQLHTGAPGAAGTSNVASNNTRKNVSACFGGTLAGGAATNTVAFGPWTGVPTSETYTHVSFWTASSSGTFLFSGTITSTAVTAGDNFSVPIGDYVIDFSLAA